MIVESAIEQAIINLLTPNSELSVLTIRATIMANHPLDYEVNNDIGAILVSCVSSEAFNGKLTRARLGWTITVVVSLGIRELIANSKLWHYKKLISDILDYSKPINGMSSLVPINSLLKYPSPINGIYWIELNYKIINYIS